MKKSIFCFLLFTFFFSQSQLFSQDEAWERIQPTPQEHSLYCVRQIPGTDKIVAVGGGSTIMYSEDEGETWDIHLNPAGLPNSTEFLSINYFDDMNGYAAANYGKIIRTTDGGQSWELIYNNQDDFLLIDRIDIYLKDAETAIVVGYDNLVLKTTNGGETWETSITPEGFFPNSIAFANSTTGYIVGRTDSAIILKTVDGGDNWITQPLNVLGIPLYSDIYFIDENEGIISGSDEGKVFIYKTFDAGNTWDTVFSSTIAYDIGEIDFKDELNGSINLFSWGTSFLYSSDGGDTWFYEEGNFFPGGRCNSFVYQSEFQLGVGYFGIIGRLNEFGGTWENLSKNTSNNLCRNVQFTSEQTGYSYFTHRGGGVPDGNVFKTINGGDSWTNTLNGFYNGDFYFLNDDLGFFSGFYISQDFITFKTENGGDSWSEISNFVPGGFFYDRDPIAIDYFDANHGLLAITDKIYKSSQIGDYWQEIFSSNSNEQYYFTDIAYLSQDTFVITSSEIYSIKAPVLIWSYDGGNTFELEILDSYLSFPNSIYFRDSLTAFMPFEDDNTILKSIDGGHTWYTTIVNDTNIASYKNVYFPSEEIGYAVGTVEYTTMYKTTYGGHNWQTTIVNDTSKPSNRMFTSNDIGYAEGSGEYTTLLKSTDGGETWNPIEIPCSSGLTEVYFHDDWHGFVFGTNGVILETFTGGIVGLEENEFVASKPFFSLSPNPAKNTIQISLNETTASRLEIEVFNLNGIRVYHENSPGSQIEVLLNIENFPKGLYFCRITQGSSVSTSRILKL